MPKVIIPDKICPHCGGNEWYTRIKNGRSVYECYVKRVERRKRYQNIENDNYLRFYIHRLKNIDIERVTENDLMEARKRIYLKRKELGSEYYKSLSKEEKFKIRNRMSQKKMKSILSDGYVKKIICDENRQKGIKIDRNDITEFDIIKRRAKIIALRKGNMSYSYIKGCIQSAIINNGDKISFKDISIRKVHTYRKSLKLIRYYRELNKLLT